VIASPAAGLAPDWRASQLQHQHYGRDNGLPSDVVWTVTQTRSGYLWLGTQNGLVRFDGLRFSTWNAATSPAFVSSDVRALAESPTGTLWIGTYGGGALHLADCRFTPLTEEDGLADDIVYDIHVGADDSVWFATANGVSRLRDGALRSWTRADGLVADRAFRIADAGGGAVWIATLTGGLSRFDGEHFTNYTTEQGLDSVQVHMLFEDGDGPVAGTYTGGLYRLADDPQALARGDLPDDLPMQSAERDRDGNFWIGSYGRGLWRWRVGGSADAFDLGERTPTHVFDLLEDREGNLWVASMNGLHRISQGRFRPWGAEEGLANATFVLTEDRSGSIWAGSEGDGLLRLTPDGRVEKLTTEHGLTSNSVSALEIDTDGRIWAGTFGSGVNWIEDGRVVGALTTADGLLSDHVFAILERSDGSVWIATEGGLNRYSDGELTIVAAGGGLPDGLTRHLLEDESGALWLSTSAGLVRYDDGDARTWGPEQGLAGALISTTWQDERGALWIGMRNGGLARLHDNTIFQYTADHGLPQTTIHAIVPDGLGRLWLTGPNSVTRVALADLDAVADGRAEGAATRRFDEADGLRSSQFLGGFQPPGLRASDGRLWFPTNRGLVVTDPADSPRRGATPKLLIEQLRADGRRTGSMGRMRLAPAVDSLEVDYTVPRIHAPERIVFRYRLRGFDEDWQLAGARRTAYFTGLGPGALTFEVQAALDGASFDDSDSVLSQSFELYREPHWFQTWWFLGLAIALTGLAGYGLYRFALARMHRRQRRLERLINKRTRELRQALVKVERLSRIDGLTGAANRRFFEERLRSAWRAAVRDGKSVGIVLIDIDRFKQFNDSRGHQAGDDCLQRVAEALESGVVRENDLAARYGGEEFVVLLSGADREATLRVAERIRTAVDALEIPHPDSDVARRVTVSMGCATRLTDDADSPERLIDRADRALSRAKRGGRNRIEFGSAGG